jgi:anti-sigma regulatory factor (Ser/Thr protein kinase)
MGITPSSRRPTSKTDALASDNGFLLKLEMPSDPSLLCVVRAALERLTEALGFSPSDCRSVTRAVDEALTNVMRHCYGGLLDQPVELYFKRLGANPSAGPKGALEIVLCDHGPPVDPAKFQARSLDEVRPGGLGLHLIRQSMDEISYERVRGANQFRLIKYFASSKQP